VSSKFCPILTLPGGKDILILIEYEGRWAGHSGEEKISCIYQELNPRPFSP